MKDFEQHCEDVLRSLRDSVAEALETKRRLGHYAVIVEQGQPRRVPAEQLGPFIAAAKTN